MADLAASGKIRYEVHYYPLFQPTGWAIKAVECAGEQGYWWAMHDRIFEDQAQGIHAQETAEDLDALFIRYADELGLDTEAFTQCFTSDEKAQEFLPRVQAQASAGQELGIKGTPSFVINGELVSLKTWDDLINAVKEALEAQ